MKNAVMPLEDYDASCDKIREKTETTDLIKSGEMPEKIEEVYEAGQVTGQKTEYDRFWDVIQKKGDSVTTDYAPRNGVFNGRIFNFANFYPKYDIRPVGSAEFLFYAWEKRENIQGSLTERLKECGVVLDTSQATNLTHIFDYGRFTELPTIDFSSVTEDSTGCFANNWGALKTIEKIIVHENLKYPKWFDNSSGLENVTFEGVIGQNGLSFSDSPLLTKESLLNVINCLKDFRETVVEHSGVNVSMPYILTTNTLVEGAKYYLTYEGDNYEPYTAEATAGQVTVMASGISAVGLQFEMPSQTSGDIPLIWVYQDGENLMYDAYFSGISNAKITLSKAPTETRSITFGASNLAKLTDAEKAVVTQKGWTLL